MKPIPIAQYLNQFGKAEPTRSDRLQRESVLLKSRILSTPARHRRADRRGVRTRPAPRHGGGARRIRRRRSPPQRDQQDERDAAERLAWQANEYAKFAERFEDAMAAIEDELAKGVARVLKPLLIEERVKQVTQALSENLAKILSRDAPSALKITGPEALLSVLRGRLAAHPVTVEYVAGDSVDVSVEAHQTIIQSQLQAWIDHIEAMGE